MKKISILSLVMALMLFAMTACGGSSTTATTETAPEETATTKVVTDILGREVEVPTEINSIVVTPIPYTSMIYAIDGTGEKLIAIHPSAKKAYEKSMLKVLAPEIENASDEYIAADFTVNVEEIVKLNPDVVILWSNQEDDLKKLEQMNIPVITLTNGANSDIDQMLANMKIIGSLLGKEEQADALIQYNIDTEAYFQGKAGEIDEASKPKVLYLRDKELKGSAGDSFNQRLIELAGGVNVASEVAGAWVEMSMEQIIAWDPEIIYLSHFDSITPEDLYNNTIEGQDWSQVSAVKNKKVFKTPIGIYRWDAPNAETPLFLKWMGQVQQPEVFADYNLENDVKDFYKNFFGHDLTDQELASIFNK